MMEWRRGGLVALLVLLGVIALTVALLAMALERPEHLWLLVYMSSIVLGVVGLLIGLASGSLLLGIVLCLVGLALPPLLVLVFIPILITALIIGLLILAALLAGVLGRLLSHAS